jgi:5-methylcytosine-specific restriction protein B
MSKLNKIFFGPAGTGKTRRAIEESIQIISESKDLENIPNIQNYDICLKHFKKSSNPLSLDISFDLIEKIHKDKSDLKKILAQIPRGVEITLKDMEKYKENYSKYPLIETVTFHPSYTYQDFVEGISVETTDKNQIIYKVKDGIFKKICDRAIENPNYNYVLLIDEINRGDISSIFGELFTLLEDSKRKGENEELSINLPYSKDNKGNPKKLIVPSNLYIISTMNTVDKSIALIDVALRRRFDFEECMPRYDLKEFNKCKLINLSELLGIMNARITILKNENYQIGHSYFLNITSIEDMRSVMQKSIIPLLQEYFYDDWKSICAVLNQSYLNPKENKILKVVQENNKLFKNEFNDLTEYQNKKVFNLRIDFSANDIKEIYE